MPTSGIRYSFEKIYANQADEDAYFSLPYASGFGQWIAHGIVGLGALLLCMGLAAFLSAGRKAGRKAIALAASGTIFLSLSVGYLGIEATASFIIGGIFFAGLMAYVVKLLVAKRRANSASQLMVSTRPAGDYEGEHDL